MKKNKIMKTIKIVTGVLVLLVVAYLLGGKLNNTIVYQVQEKEVILDNLIGKVNELKGGLMSELKQCESGSIPESEGLVTFDPNPKNKKVQIPSFGSYQFKKSTVQFYYKKFYNQDITGLEAINIALSDEKAGELANDVIFKDGALDNWYNCTKKLGLKEDLAIINKLLE